MPIVSSEIVEDAQQATGFRYITERHVDHVGVARLVRYLASPSADAVAIMTARIVALEQRLADAEFARNLALIFSGEFAAVTTQHMTMADAQAALREVYRTATGEQVGRLAAFLLTLSDARLRALFNVSQGQIGALRSRLQARVDALAAVETAAGE